MNMPACPFSNQDIEAITQNMLKNITSESNGLTMVDKNITTLAEVGAVIASPATPDNQFSQSYFFHWVRDGAITMSTVCRLYEKCSDPKKKANYKALILNYVNFVEKIQSQPALNGVDTLGEPKFNVDGTLWTDPWGRPQGGGAAYQALVLAKILDILKREGNNQEIVHKIYNNKPTSLLKANLEYCAKFWSEPCFSMWEELKGKHFSVVFPQHVALMVGALIALELSDPKAAAYYNEVNNYIYDVLRAHWQEDLGFYFETLNKENELGGNFNASILIALCNTQCCAIIHDEFLLTSYRSLSTIFYLRNAFENLYQINVKHKIQGKKGALIGRYVEDIYDGNQSIYGNPWFLCSATLASAYYIIANQLLVGKPMPINFLVQQFLLQITPADFSLNETINKQHKNFNLLITRLIEEGDAILDLLKEYSVAYPDGSRMHMSEQINRSSGKQVSARDLSWSYSAVLDALDEREKLAKVISAL